MSLISHAINKLRHLSYTYVLRHFGYGNRVSKDVWEQQFDSNTWDYLENKDEAAHYHVIVKLYNQYKNTSTVLDVGCGQGVLYKYLKNSSALPDSQYTGIDISKNAVENASRQFPGINFSQLDFDKSGINKKFDVIIFNETLYYFTRPLKTLERCTLQNLNPNGAFIISMCYFVGHEKIWEQLAKHYTIITEEEVVNDKGQSWKIKLVTPVRPLEAARLRL